MRGEGEGEAVLDPGGGDNASYNLYRYVPSKGGMVLICLGPKSENGHGF